MLLLVPPCVFLGHSGFYSLEGVKVVMYTSYGYTHISMYPYNRTVVKMVEMDCK